MMKAPADSPPSSASQPAVRPIVSTTKMRLCEPAVVRRRSISSTMTLSAVSKPRLYSVTGRSLSIVLGMPMTWAPALDSFCGHADGVIAADGDEHVQAEVADVVERLPGAVAAGLVGVGAGGAQVGAAVAVPGAHGGLVERHDPLLELRPARLGFEKTLPAVADAPDFVLHAPLVFETVIEGGLDHPFDRRVKTGAVAAGRQNADPAFLHTCSSDAVRVLSGFRRKMINGIIPSPTMSSNSLNGSPN